VHDLLETSFPRDDYWEFAGALHIFLGGDKKTILLQTSEHQDLGGLSKARWLMKAIYGLCFSNKSSNLWKIQVSSTNCTFVSLQITVHSLGK